MGTLTLKILFMIGFVSAFIIRSPHQRENKENKVAVDRKTAQEKVLLVLVSIGMVILPLVYVFSPWLSVADYHSIVWIGYSGAVCFGVALWLFWRSPVGATRGS
jgi:protein-S-isoprenylcysteine O-methyltransferase Ste14